MEGGDSALVGAAVDSDPAAAGRGGRFPVEAAFMVDADGEVQQGQLLLHNEVAAGMMWHTRYAEQYNEEEKIAHFHSRESRTVEQKCKFFSADFLSVALTTEKQMVGGCSMGFADLGVEKIMFFSGL